MKKVYLVVPRDRSAFNIEAIFSSRERAMDYIARQDREFYVFDHVVNPDYDKGKKTWVVDCSTLGVTAKISESNFDVPDTCRKAGYIVGYFRFIVRAETCDMAVRIARERYDDIQANKDLWVALNTRKEDFLQGAEPFPAYNFITKQFSN